MIVLKKYQKDYRKKSDGNNNWAARLRWLYGITSQEYFELLDRQNGVCAICGKTNPSGRRLSVDHDHFCCASTKSCGKCIRGLLCELCNRGLGNFKDDPLLLENAINYLHAL